MTHERPLAVGSWFLQDCPSTVSTHPRPASPPCREEASGVNPAVRPVCSRCGPGLRGAGSLPLASAIVCPCLGVGVGLDLKVPVALSLQPPPTRSPDHGVWVPTVRAVQGCQLPGTCLFAQSTGFGDRCASWLSLGEPLGMETPLSEWAQAPHIGPSGPSAPWEAGVGRALLLNWPKAQETAPSLAMLVGVERKCLQEAPRWARLRVQVPQQCTGWALTPAVPKLPCKMQEFSLLACLEGEAGRTAPESSRLCCEAEPLSPHFPRKCSGQAEKGPTRSLWPDSGQLPDSDPKAVPAPSSPLLVWETRSLEGASEVQAVVWAQGPALPSCAGELLS